MEPLKDTEPLQKREVMVGSFVLQGIAFQLDRELSEIVAHTSVAPTQVFVGAEEYAGREEAVEELMRQGAQADRRVHERVVQEDDAIRARDAQNMQRDVVIGSNDDVENVLDKGVSRSVQDNQAVTGEAELNVMAQGNHPSPAVTGPAPASTTVVGHRGSLFMIAILGGVLVVVIVGVVCSILWLARERARKA